MPQHDDFEQKRADPAVAGANGTAGAQGAQPERAEAASPSRARRMARYTLRALGGLLGLVLLLVAGVLLVLQTEWGAEKAKNLAVDRLNALFDGAELRVEQLSGNFVGHLALYDVNLVRADGTSLAHVDTLTAAYRLLPLLRNRLHLTDLYLASPRLQMEQQADGSWDLLRVVATDSAAVDTAQGQTALVIELDHFDLHSGSLRARFHAPERDSVLLVEDFGLAFVDMRLGETLRLRLDTLFARVDPTGGRQEALHLALSGALDEGRFSLGGLRLQSPHSDVRGQGLLALPSADNRHGRDLDFRLQAHPLAFQDLRLFLPGLDPDGTVELDLRVEGAQTQVKAHLEAAFSDGSHVALVAEGTPPGEGPVRYRADGQVRRLDPGFFTGDPSMAGRINADVDVDLEGPVPERVSGKADLLVFDTHYGAYGLDRTTLESTFTDGLGRLSLHTGLRGFSLTLGGTLRPFDEAPSYDLEGRLADLDIGRFTEGGTQHSAITAGFSVSGRGTDPQTADLTARLDLAPSQINRYRLRDGHVAARLEGGALRFDTRLLLPEGLVAAEGEATFGDEVRYDVRRGIIRNLDVAALSGDSTRSALSGHFALRGRGTDPEAMTLEADLDLQDSYYGAYRLARADLGAVLRSGRLTLQAGADLGPGGTFALAAAAHPFQDEPALERARLQFSHVDVGALTQSPAQHSDLNGLLTVSGRGTDPATMTLEARLDLAPSRMNEQSMQEGQARVTLQGGRLQFDSRLTLPEGHLLLAGAAHPFQATPVYVLREGTFAGLNVGALTGSPHLQTRLNGTFTLEGTGIDPATMALDARLRFARSSVNEAVLQEGLIAARLTEGLARLEAGMDVEEGNILVEARGRLFDEVPRYEAHAAVQDLDLGKLTGSDTLAARFSLGVDVEGQGRRPEAMQLRGRFLARGAAFDTLRLDTLGAGFRLAGGVLHVDSLLLRSNVAAAQGGGPLALFDTTGRARSDFRLAGDILSLAPIRPLVGAEVFSLREGHLQATVQGPSDRLGLEATVGLSSFAYDDLRLAGLDAQLQGALGPDRSLAGGTVQAELNYLSTPGLSVRLTSLQADYDGSEVAFTGATSLDERRDTRLSGRLDLRPESRRFFIDSLNLRFDEDRWTLHEPVEVSYGAAYRISDLRLSSGSQQITAGGVIDPQGEQDFHLAVEGLRLGAFADLLGLEDLDGTLSSTFDLTGPAREPLLEGQLGTDLRYRQSPVGDLRLSLQYDDHRLNLETRLTHREGSTLDLQGYLPLDLSLAPAGPETAAGVEGVAAASGVDLRVRSDGFAIDWFRPFLDRETVEALAGRLSTDLHIGGTMEAPALDGTLRLADGRLGLPRLGVTYEDIQVEAALEGGLVTLNRAVLRAGDGRLTAQGRMEMPELTLGQFDVDVDLEDFRAIRSEDYRATVSGDLALSGTTEAPVVSGVLRLRDSDFYLTSTAGGDLREVPLIEEDVRMLEEFFGYRVSERDTTISEIYQALALDLNVELERDTWIRQTANPEMAIELAGIVELDKQPGGELQLFRSIEVIPQRSYIRQFGRRFDLERGEVTFNGPVSELMMDIAAQYEVRSRENPGQPEAVITLTLTGRLDDLTFELGSDPPMSNTDIVSYIATGRPAGEALQFGGGGGEGGEGLLTQGGGLAANQLAGLVEGLAAEELGLDVIEIQQDGLRGTQLIAGKYVAPGFYMGIQQPVTFTSTDNAAAGTKPTEVTLEYELFRWLLLQFLSGTSTSSVQLNLMGRYAFY